MKNRRIPRKIKKIYKKLNIPYSHFLNPEGDYIVYLDQMQQDWNTGVGYI